MDLAHKIRRGLAGGVVWLAGMTVGMTAPVAQPIPFSNSFETYPNGTPVQTLTTDGWDASSPSVVVQTNVAWDGTHAVMVPVDTGVSNAIAGATVTNVWLDCAMLMQPRSETNGASVGSNAVVAVNLGDSGYLQAYNAQAGWLALSNTVWGTGLPAVTTGQWVRVTVFLDYGTHRYAAFQNGALVTELAPFVNTNINVCSSLRMQGDNTSSTYLDGFQVSQTYPATLTNDWNSDGVTDAWEVAAFGYLALALNVGSSQTYTSIQSAVNAALPRYTINVTPGTYTENVFIAQSLAGLTGTAFTVNGSLTLAAGASLTVSGGLSVTGTVGVSSSACLVVKGQLTGRDVSVSGTLAFAPGGTLTCTNLTVGNNVTVSLTNTTLTASNLVICTGGRMVLSNCTVTANGMTLRGSFTLDQNWNVQGASALLPYQDDFEPYPLGTPMNGLSFRGWGATTNTVAIETNQAFSGTNGVNIGYGAILSNRVSAATASQVWTDLRGLLRYDANDESVAVRSNAAFMMAVTTNGYLSVYDVHDRTNGAWDVCTKDVWGNGVAALGSSEWVRVSVFNNYATKRCAVFLRGILVRQQLPFINTNLTSYSTLGLGNNEPAVTYLDDVYIGAQYPSSLTNDVDQNGVPDALTIAERGDVFSSGTIFKIR